MFEKGVSGNPTGRPRGTKDKRTELRELLEPHAPALASKAVELALAGDVTALKMCLDRLIPSIRSIVIEETPQQETYEDIVKRIRAAEERGKPLE